MFVLFLPMGANDRFPVGVVLCNQCKVFIIQSSRVSAIRGCLSIWMDNWNFGSVSMYNYSKCQLLRDIH